LYPPPGAAATPCDEYVSAPESEVGAAIDGRKKAEAARSEVNTRESIVTSRKKVQRRKKLLMRYARKFEECFNIYVSGTY